MPRSTSSDLDMDSIGRSSHSDWGSDSDSYGSRGRGGSINDDFGDSLEKAGYDRVNDSRGGWREDDSNENYTSTTDRMNRHLDLYGKNNGYTNNFNNTFRNSGFGGGNRLSSESGFGGQSAISKSVNSHYQSNANKSLSQYNNPVVDQKNLTGGLFGKGGVQAPYSPRQDWENVSFFTSQDRLKDIAQHNTKASLDTEAKGNIVGNHISTMAGSFLEPTSLPTAIASGLGQLALSKAGSIADKVTNQSSPSLDKLTPSQKAAYAVESQKVRDAYQEDIDSLKSKAIGFAGSGLGILGGAVLGPAGGSFFGSAAKTMADNYRHKSAMEYAGNKLNSNVINGELEEEAEKSKQGWKDWAAMRAMAGNSEPIESQGILDRMQKQLGINNSTKSSDNTVYKIPQLVNLWNNISIK